MTPKTAKHVRTIRECLARGMKQNSIAELLGISPSRVCILRQNHIDGGARKARSTTYHANLFHRWMTDHDIRAMGERAVRETA